MMDKRALRTSMRKTLSLLSQEEILVASRRACERVSEIKALQKSAAVSVFLSMPAGECQTHPLIHYLFEQGKSVFVPRVEGPGRFQMRMLRVESIAQLESFPRSKWGIPEPTAADAMLLEDGLTTAVIDTVIVPAVAFDASCRRLGHGKGYYGTCTSMLHKLHAISHKGSFLRHANAHLSSCHGS